MLPLAGTVLVLLCAAGAALFTATWVTTPSTADAVARAEVVSRLHHGEPLPADQMPPLLAEALVAIEDTGFYREPGISPEGMARAAVFDAEHRCLCQGGSSLDQQLAEGLYLRGSDRSWPRYWRGVVLALKLNRRLTKQQILAAYFSEVYLGHGAYGAVAAARVYFHRPLADLTSTRCWQDCRSLPPPTTRSSIPCLLALDCARCWTRWWRSGI
jgi:membrane peptidoglycan carboxypeptidase